MSMNPQVWLRNRKESERNLRSDVKIRKRFVLQ
jgi:hypothetical protein